MSDQKDRQFVQASIDSGLSAMQGDPWLAQRIMRQERTEGNVKKAKLSVTAILVIVLLCITVTAVAAVLLSMREVVEETAIPLAAETQGDSYTMDNIRTILRIAQENGITLSENTLEQIDSALAQGEGYAKEELLMALAKAELGDDPALWTLDEQNWFDDVCVAIGFVPEKEKAMPARGEAAKQPVLEAAKAYIQEKYGPDVPLDDAARYTAGVQYLDGGADGEYPGRYWSVSFTPHDLEGAEYWVYLSDDGKILGEWTRPGLSDGLTVEQIYNAYQNTSLYGGYMTWDQQIFRSLQNAVLQTKEEASPVYRCMRHIVFPDLPEGGISSEQAAEIAKQHYPDEIFYPQTEAYLVQVSSAALLDKHGDLTDNPVWKVLITSKGGNVYTVEVDCITGSVICARRFETQYRPWWTVVVPWGVIDEVGMDYWDTDSAG